MSAGTLDGRSRTSCSTRVDCPKINLQVRGGQSSQAARVRTTRLGYTTDDVVSLGQAHRGRLTRRLVTRRRCAWPFPRPQCASAVVFTTSNVARRRSSISTRASTVSPAEHHADEPHLDLAVREELVAPRVEQHAVRGSGGLHALRDESGQRELGRQRRIGVEVAAPRVRAHQLLGDRRACAIDALGHGVTSERRRGSERHLRRPHRFVGCVGGRHGRLDVDVRPAALLVAAGDPARS